MDSTKYRFFAPCPRGLEGVLENELRELGVSITNATAGGVGFYTAWSTVYRINLRSHIASRVLWEIGHDTYRTEEDVYGAAYRLQWPEWFTFSHTIKVKVTAQRCSLRSLDFLTLRIKDAVCDKFVAMCGKRPSVDRRQPDIRIDVFLVSDDVTFYLDTSGEPLFKRGYRQATAEAPLRENLAAGVLRLAGWTPDELLMDPMCGSGTIPLEAALIARHSAPGFGRSFAFEHLRNYDAIQWADARKAAQSARRTKVRPVIYASDHNAAAIKMAACTFQAASVESDIQLRHSDVLSIDPPGPQGLIVINPPYGMRLGDATELRAFYPQLGDWLKQRFVGWRAYVLTADFLLAKAIGLSPSRKIPLYNGPIECRLYEFKIVSGRPTRPRKLPSIS
ncbi:MAG TPA: THUMP domain-containing protein [Nitrospira sp.]|nr:THUMP domain-containing protein [Nitrospira sp.]